MTVKPDNKHSPHYSQIGFTLVEIMVGLVIGLLATLVILKVLSVFEAQKRTTTGAADAQINGNIALYDIERDMQMAGYPLMPYGTAGVADSALECTSLTINGTLDATTPNRLTPVAITDGGASGSDSITIRYGDSATGGIMVEIKGPPSAAANAPSPARDVPVDSSFGCKNSDTVLFVNGSTCAMVQLHATSGVPATGANAGKVVTTVDNSAETAGAVVPTSGNMACLGTWNEVTYAVNPATSNLERTVRTTTTPSQTTPIIAGIVNLQAQYGIAQAGLPSTDPNFNQVVQWVNATGTTWSVPTPANRNLIKAIRIAVVARNARMEPNVVTTNIPTWTGSASSPAPTVDLSATDPNWNHYRYRVFDTIIPIRNVIWYKSTL